MKKRRTTVILAVINNKGGVGKTTCTVNLSHALSMRGKKVIVIDNDPQSNSTALLLGVSNPPKTLFNILTHDGTSIEECIYPTGFGFDVLPNHTDTAALEFDLYQDVESYRILRELLRDYCTDNYDFTIIDCPPTLGLWVVQAMIMADAVIVPVEAGSKLSLDGLGAVYVAVEKMSLRVNADLKFLRAIINKVDLRTRVSKLIVETMKRKFPGKSFETTIPVNTAIQQAEANNTTVISYDPQCHATKRFKQLADELIEIVNGER